MTGMIKKRQRESEHPEKDKVLELVQSTDEPLKRFNMLIPLSLHTALKVKAAGEGRKMKDVVVELIQEYLKEEK
uniref:56B-like ribbon-helix-helix domain-containing protein n=1 Tax=Candidatus Kentrum sp. DK TaxID=2126562 RepID=A0A450TMN0_9GAMM|nr:MAG: hypothetical protein BECKDK2373B_GA0170837_12302 [Candidatus Kentron sp. DK]